MADKVKVEAELNFDTNAQKMLGELKQGFGELQNEVASSNDGVKQFATTFAAMASAQLLMPIVGHIRSMSTASFELANQAHDTQQGIAGMMAAMSPRAWADARGGAELLYDEFTDLSIAIGQNKHDIEGAHAAMSTFLGGGDLAFEVAGRNLKNVTAIANVMGFSAQSVGDSFGKLAAGFVQTESPIFNLLRGTGIFAAELSQVNAEWQKLTQEERINKLEGAFGNIANNLSQAAPTMSDMVTSMKEAGGSFLESFGGAALKEVLDNTESLRQSIIEGEDSFDSFAAALGKDFGQEMGLIIDELADGARYLKENGAEIKEDIVEAFAFAKSVFDFMIDNSALIGTGIGITALLKMPGVMSGLSSFAGGAMGKSTGGVAGTAGSMIPAIVSALTQAKTAHGGGAQYTPNLTELGDIASTGQIFKANVSNTVATIGGFGQAVLGMAPPLWGAVAAATALTAGFAYFVHEGHKADEESRARIKEIVSRERERSEQLGQLSEIEHRHQVEERQELIRLAEELGEKTAAIRRLNEASANKREMDERYINPALAAAQNLQLTDKGAAMPEVYRAQEETAVHEMSMALKKAVETGDTEVSKALMLILLDNEKLKTAFMNSADTVTIGADALKLSLKGLEELGFGNGNLSKFFKEELGREFKGAAAKTQVNFNGGQTFKIQQEFRDQDPDRIAVAFENRITRSAVARVQASTSAPFGA